MPERVVFFNGVFVPEWEAKLSIYDSALMFGDMVFEMTRSFRKEQFQLREHLERLYDSMRYFRIPSPMSIETMESAALETVECNEAAFAPDDEHRLMINVSRGLLPLYENKGTGLAPGPNVIIADYPLRWTVAGMGRLFSEGVNAVVVPQRAIPASLLEPKVKNRSRVHYKMAMLEASQQKGKDNWALMLDPDGFIAEGAGANFFIVKKGVLITPEPRNILRGISRRFVMEQLAASSKIPCVERNIEPYDVATADEAFFTATPFCILPVTRFNHEPIGEGAPGLLTRRLLLGWSNLVGVDIEEQIRGWDSNGPNAYDNA